MSNNNNSEKPLREICENCKKLKSFNPITRKYEIVQQNLPKEGFYDYAISTSAANSGRKYLRCRYPFPTERSKYCNNWIQWVTDDEYWDWMKKQDMESHNQKITTHDTIPVPNHFMTDNNNNLSEERHQQQLDRIENMVVEILKKLRELDD